MLLVPILAIIITTSLASPFLKVYCEDKLPEDLNGDGKVDIYDALMLAAVFGTKQGDANWNPNADVVADGKIDILDAIRIAANFGQQAKQCTVLVHINPRTLNLKSKGRWITVYIIVSEECNANDIDVSTIKINDTIVAETKPVNVENNALMVKFSRAAIQSYILKTANLNDKFVEVSLTVSGKLGGNYFVATDSITVIANMS